VTAGLRVFNVEQEDSALASGTLNGGTSTTGGKSSVTAVQQKYLVEFKATPDNLLYAQASQGYRNGGPTGTVPAAACAAALASIGYSSVPPSFGPDKLWNYEIGSKNTLFNRRMTLNASAFYIDWTNIQTSISLACGFGFVANSGKARSRGFELETSVEPVDGLTIGGSLVYTDAVLTQAAPGVRAANGDPLPLVSRWSWNVNAQYRHDLGNGLNAFVRSEVNHVGSRWNVFRNGNLALSPLDPYTTVNARIGIGNETWSAAIFATNLFDERVVTNRSAGSSAFELVGRPRTIGVTAKVGF
jgi:outer membrane receptor protein involved in Fe transport